MVLLLLSEEVVVVVVVVGGPLVFPLLITSLYRGLIPILQFLKGRLRSGGLVSLLVISVTDGALQ